MDYTFTQQADLSALGYYNFDCSVSITGDAVATNDTWSVKHVAHGDDFMTVDVSTDSQGGQAWYITNIVSGDTIAQHGAYQWNLVNDITTVCLNNADCYNFSWVGGTSNDVVLSHGGNVVDTRTATGDYQVFNFGSGCAADGADFTAITTASVVAVGNNNIEGTVMNIGTANLTSFDVVYSIDGGANSVIFTATCNETTGNSYTFTHNVPWNTVNTGNYDVQVTISNVNGNGGASYTLNKDIQVLGAVFPKTVVYEEGTGTWCGWCTRGLVGLSTMANTHANDGTWIGIGVHNADPMTVAAYDTEIGNFIGGYPSGIMDRHNVEVDPGLASLTAAYDQHVQINPEAKIEITGQTWNDASRAFTVDVATTFALDMNGADYNTALIVLENGVTGGNGYEQANYYDDGAAGPLVDWDGFNYVGAGDPIPAANMVYDHVARQLVDGWDGSANSVPTNVVFNTANPFNYSGSIPAAHDETETEFVALIINNATGEIVNATHAALNIPVGINIINNSNFNIYPNPTTGLINIEGVKGANIVVYDVLGAIVHNEVVASAKTTIDLSNLNKGSYFVKIINNDEVSTQRIVLTK
ncbi:MAG: T9SS type A sorting domain-containing protein [Vicingaceae bacterium]